ncbi:BQ5605_C008g05005 [Microbotryum silenes-dioicae]|uniref:BQ5605_C008g05005 protein n=1 Tax=Microbotryum silenes-dioicae TaxID=796604 RepID=A0A2X0MYU9_9BASI|nr:BQ5605_C008g05005 [Microbotryum silenes-dioicae]
MVMLPALQPKYSSRSGGPQRPRISTSSIVHVDPTNSAASMRVGDGKARGPSPQPLGSTATAGAPLASSANREVTTQVFMAQSIQPNTNSGFPLRPALMPRTRSSPVPDRNRSASEHEDLPPPWRVDAPTTRTRLSPSPRSASRSFVDAGEGYVDFSSTSPASSMSSVATRRFSPSLETGVSFPASSTSGLNAGQRSRLSQALLDVSADISSLLPSRPSSPLSQGTTGLVQAKVASDRRATSMSSLDSNTLETIARPLERPSSRGTFASSSPLSTAAEARQLERTPSVPGSDDSLCHSISTGSASGWSPFFSPHSAASTAARTSFASNVSKEPSTSPPLGLGILEIQASSTVTTSRSLELDSSGHRAPPLQLAHSSRSPPVATPKPEHAFGDGDLDISLAELQRFAQSLPSPALSMKPSYSQGSASNWPPPSPGILTSFQVVSPVLVQTLSPILSVAPLSPSPLVEPDSECRSSVATVSSTIASESDGGSGGWNGGDNSSRSTAASELDWKMGAQETHNDQDNAESLGPRSTIINWTGTEIDMMAVLPMSEWGVRLDVRLSCQALMSYAGATTGTTHLLLSHMTPSAAISSLLRKVLPSLNPGLTVLNLSHNSLHALPSTIASCASTLEEMSVSGNPIRDLPQWLTDFTRLRVFLADECELSSISEVVNAWPALETLSLRRNRIDRLPPWLARSSNLCRFDIDGNDWSGEWLQVIAPLLTDERAVAGTIPSATEGFWSGSSTPSGGWPDSNPPHASAPVSISLDPGQSLKGSRSVSASSLQFPAPEVGGIHAGSVFGKMIKTASSRIRSRSISGKKLSQLDRAQSEPTMPLSVLDIRPCRGEGRKRRSFLLTPCDIANISEPEITPMPRLASLGGQNKPSGQDAATFATKMVDSNVDEEDHRAGLRIVMGYLRDLDDLTLGVKRNSFSTLASSQGSVRHSSSLGSIAFGQNGDSATVVRRAQSTRRNTSGRASTMDEFDALRQSLPGSTTSGPLKIRDDPARREAVVKEIIETEKTYLRGLEELVAIYVGPSAGVIDGKELLPAVERRAVFSNVEAIRDFHAKIFFPDLLEVVQSATKASASIRLIDPSHRWLMAAIGIGRVFARHAAVLKIYSAYVNAFDGALTRIQSWIIDAAPSRPGTSSGSREASTPGLAANKPDGSHGGCALTMNQKKRIKAFLKRCKSHPDHSQISLESYLLLPVQRVPRYRMLLESLLSCTPYILPVGDSCVSPHDTASPLVPHPTLYEALTLVSEVAVSMNERKRETEGRAELLYWQGRIGHRFRSPLVQPHRSLIKSGAVNLVRTVKRAGGTVAQKWSSKDSGEYLVQEVGKLSLIALLVTDLLVLVKAPPPGVMDPHAQVDLYTVIRLSPAIERGGTFEGPASVYGADHTTLRIVCDTRAILYLDCSSVNEASTWARLINVQWELNT